MKTITPNQIVQTARRPDESSIMGHGGEPGTTSEFFNGMAMYSTQTANMSNYMSPEMARDQYEQLSHLYHSPKNESFVVSHNSNAAMNNPQMFFSQTHGSNPYKSKQPSAMMMIEKSKKHSLEGSQEKIETGTLFLNAEYRNSQVYEQSQGSPQRMLRAQVSDTTKA